MRLIPILLLLAGCASASSPSPAPVAAAAETVVVLVRHAEKAEVEGADPPLSPAGEARARALAEYLADAGVDAVFATQFERTRATAQPLAERLGLAVTVRDAGRGYPEALAREIRERHRGQTVVVVGHSNTTPAVVRALGGVAPDIPESDYDNLFILHLAPDGTARTVRATYGAE